MKRTGMSRLRKGFYAVLLLLLCGSLQAQFNFNEMSKKTIYFGIAMGVNVADFKIIRAPNAAANDSIHYIKTAIGPGFNLGIIGNYQFHRYFEFKVYSNPFILRQTDKLYRS